MCIYRDYEEFGEDKWSLKINMMVKVRSYCSDKGRWQFTKYKVLTIFVDTLEEWYMKYRYDFKLN